MNPIDKKYPIRNMIFTATISIFFEIEMIVGIGTDIVHIPRFLKLTNPLRLSKRILSPQEQYLLNTNNKDKDLRMNLCKVWACKEAAYKSMSHTRRLTWKEVSLIQKAEGDGGNYKRVELIYTNTLM